MKFLSWQSYLEIFLTFPKHVGAFLSCERGNMTLPIGEDAFPRKFMESTEVKWNGLGLVLEWVIFVLNCFHFTSSCQVGECTTLFFSIFLYKQGSCSSISMKQVTSAIVMIIIFSDFESKSRIWRSKWCKILLMWMLQLIEVIFG